MPGALSMSGAISTHDADVGGAAAAQRGNLSLEQWVALELNQALRAIVPEGTHAAPASRGKDQVHASAHSKDVAEQRDVGSCKR